MRTLAIANMKGGSGKTTTAVNLAAALAARGRRVLLVDLDPQASAGSWLSVGAGADSRGLLDAVLGDAPLAPLALETGISGLSVIPAPPALYAAERELARHIGAETLLRSQVAKMPRGRWDWLILDCPPTLSLLAVQALVAARELLVPCPTESMALTALAEMLRVVEDVRARLNRGLTLTVVAVRVDARTRLAREALDALRDKFGPRFCETVIRESVRLQEAPSHQQPITTYAPDSHGAEDYRALAAELERRKA